MNKKGQFSPNPSSGVGLGFGAGGGTISPLLILGIIIFVLPFLGPIVNITLPKWIGTVGFIILIIGIIHTAYKSLR